MPAKESMPSTLRRSPAKAQRTWAKAYDSAIEEYGHGRRAQQTAYAALKHSFEKAGDHWEPKSGGRGPSDERAATPRGKPARSRGGVNANASKSHLYELATRLGVRGRSSMSKQQLVEAVEKANARKTAAARSTR